MTDSTATALDVRERIDRFLSELGLTVHGPRVVPLTGDASDRRYFRVLLADEPSQVLAVHTGPITFDQLPFANVARLLSAMPLPVPRILGHSDPLGIIALDDLGDVTLQAHLGAASTAERTALYREAIALIETMQRRGRELASTAYVPYTLAFDVEKLTWELRFFVQHFLEAHRGASLSAAERVALDEEFRAVAEELAAEPRVLCHRDYHSRNLMFHDGALHVIDFQDARMGPDTYDLVSLLRDSYVDFTAGAVDALIDHFLELRATRGHVQLKPEARNEFRRRFDLMALQRNLKALGTFGFQTTARGNPSFIQYIPRTLNHVRSNVSRNANFGRLQELLARHVEEMA